MEKPLNQPNKKLSEGVDSIQKARENEHPSFQKKNHYQPLDHPQKKWKNEGFKPHGRNPAPPGMYKTL